MPVGVITDSAAALPAPLSARLGVKVVPMRLTIGQATYEGDGVALEDVVARFDEGVRTSGPAPASFRQAFMAADQGQGVVVVSVSERMSSTYKSALMASELHPGPVRVVDSQTAAGGQALVVLAAAEAASRGLSLDEVAARAEQVRAGVHLVATVGSLEYLARGGRIPDLAGRAGRYLGVRPLFEFRSGRIRPLRPSLSQEGALDAMLGHWRRSVGGLIVPASLHVVVSHALDTEMAEALVSAIRAEVEPVTCLVESFSPVMVAHTGPGVTGLAWRWE
jgi:DegV family protein with EDD domain